MAETRPGTVPAVVGGVLLLLFSGGLLGALIFLLVGGIFALVFPLVFGLPLGDLELDRGAVTAVGTVVEVEPTPEFQVQSEPTVRLHYRFDPGDGERTDSIQVRESHELGSLDVGQEVTIEYLPDDPGVSRIQGGKHAVAGWGGAAGLIFGALGLVVTVCAAMPCLLGLVLLIWGLLRMARARRPEPAAA